MYVLNSLYYYTLKHLNLHEINLFYHNLLSNMKADHLRNFNSLALTKFGKYKQQTNSSKIFSFYPELWMYHTLLTWYER
jgi:uncharacterized Zn-finger protein